MSGSHFNGRAMTLGFCSWRASNFRYKYRIAFGTAMTDNGVKDTPAQPQTSQWGRLGAILGGVEFP